MPTQTPVARRRDAVCIAVLLLVITLFLAPALRPGYTILPLGLEAGIAPWHKQVTQQAQNSLLSDPFYTFYPRRHVFTAALRGGTYPLWNPYIFGGHPVVGDTAAQTFYPPNAIAALFLSAARALPVLAWFHLSLTGVAMYAFLRLIRLRPPAALFGALAWALNGNAIVWLENPHRLSTLAWMPVVFLCYELAIQKRRTWPAIAAGLLYGVSILGGHTQLALGMGMALGAYALFQAVVRSRAAGRLAWQPLALALAVGVIGAGIGAVQLLPTAQLIGLSHREQGTIASTLASRWPWQHAVGLWVPDFFGNPVRFPFWGSSNYAEVTAYFGAFAFLLSLVAPFWSRRPRGWFFTLALLLCGLIALGTVAAWLVVWLPWTRYVRLRNFIAYVPFCGAAAAAFTLDAAARQEDRRRWGWIALAVAVAAMVLVTVWVARDAGASFAANWSDVQPHLWRAGIILVLGVAGLWLARAKPTWGLALLVVLVGADLFLWGRPFNPVNSTDILYPENEVTGWLEQDPSLYRVLPLQTDRVVFGPNVLSVLGYQETGGYTSLMVARYRALVKAIDDEVRIWWMRPNQNILVNSNFDPLFSVLNVKYVLTSHQLDAPLMSVEEARPGCVEPGIPLAAGARLTQTFQAIRPGLNRVDVGLISADGPVRFLLWRDREGGELVADIAWSAGELAGAGSLTAFFAPVADSMGQTFVWAVEVPAEAGESTVAVCRAAGDQPAFVAYSVQLQQADIRQGVWIYQNPNVLPRAYVVHRAEVVPEEELLARLTGGDVNPWTTVLLEEPLPVEAAQALVDAPVRTASAAEIVRYDLHTVEVAATMDAPGVLVLGDAFYPGWRVTVDDVPAPLLRANYALRGVYLPAGTHRVVFRFLPLPFFAGLALTVATLLVSVVVLVKRISRFEIAD